mmetsp:Transcript_175268/g.562134  ORF Transcript_175268/g.562134 Transcript_175268/m.562134 type:complete len:220 (-) Transcript_175268:430-1089(-)
MPHLLRAARDVGHPCLVPRHGLDRNWLAVGQGAEDQILVSQDGEVVACEDANPLIQKDLHKLWLPSVLDDEHEAEERGQRRRRRRRGPRPRLRRPVHVGAAVVGVGDAIPRRGKGRRGDGAGVVEQLRGESLIINRARRTRCIGGLLRVVPEPPSLGIILRRVEGRPRHGPLRRSILEVGGIPGLLEASHTNFPRPTQRLASLEEEGHGDDRDGGQGDR